MAPEWAPPALSESFIWDGGLWQKWGYPPAVQQLCRDSEKKSKRGSWQDEGNSDVELLGGGGGEGSVVEG